MNILKFFFPKPKKIPQIKMYVLVRMDIDPIHRAVQAGHAVAEYMISHYITTTWRNGIMVYLGVRNEQELNRWEARLQAKRIKFSTFVEPDWGVEPVKTATAFCDTGEIVKELPLLSLENPYFPPNELKDVQI